MKTGRALPWLLLGAVVVGVLAWATWPSGEERTVRDRAHDLAAELRCPVCEALSIADSPSTTARAIRADLRRRIVAGQSDEEIRQAYVDRYGESILLEPEGSGLGILVWGLPVAAVVLGAGGLALALRRWRREPRLHATEADEQLVSRARRAERA
jgi:cytochrome c-type biogenesis protein CcmH